MPHDLSYYIKDLPLEALIMFPIFLIRSLPNHVGLEKLAAGLEKFDIGGLLVIGGFEVTASVIQLTWYSLVKNKSHSLVALD